MSHTPALTTADIELMARLDPVLSKQYIGTFSSDRLPSPSTIGKNSALIVNFDEHFKPGSHWLCIYVNSQRVPEYFDSFGLWPIKSNLLKFVKGINNNFLYSNTKLQSFTTNSCGYYCLYYLIRRARNESATKILEMFSSKTLENDRMIVDKIKKHFK